MAVKTDRNQEENEQLVYIFALYIPSSDDDRRAKPTVRYTQEKKYKIHKQHFHHGS
jgi:hypothetical protein